MMLSLNMTFLIHILCIFSIVFTSLCIDVEVGDSGDVETFSQAGLHVTFFNSYDNQSLSVFWQGTDGIGHLMGHADPLMNLEITSFSGHSFYAVVQTNDMDEQAGYRVPPGTVTVTSKMTSFSFGIDDETSTTNMNVKKLSEKSKYQLVDTKPKGKHRESGMHPAVTFINQPTTSMSARFKSLAPNVDIWYDDGRDGTFSGNIKLGQETTTNTYEGHVFYFTEANNKAKELARFTMNKDQPLYIIRDEAHPPPQKVADELQRELDFGAAYKNRTGLFWRHYYGPNGPRDPPFLYMWPAPAIGYVHTVSTSQGYWHCTGNAEDCQSNEQLELELEVISTEPKAFIIPNFLSEFEADNIVALAEPQLKGSLVGDRESGGGRSSNTRTSRNAWIPRTMSPQTETLFRRAADLLKIDEKLLYNHKNVEDMQVVYYQVGQKYDSHHDWGVRNKPESRFITLLLYLTDQEHSRAGGETSFPKAGNGRGIKVHPGKGSAVLFYNLLEDGNGDELALHAATPVVEGEKWLSNFWVWDAHR